MGVLYMNIPYSMQCASLVIHIVQRNCLNSKYPFKTTYGHAAEVTV
jgi:hypothetical protein